MVNGNDFNEWVFTSLKNSKEIRLLPWMTNGRGIALWQLGGAILMGLVIATVLSLVGFLSFLFALALGVIVGVMTMNRLEERETNGKDLKVWTKDVITSQFDSTYIVNRKRVNSVQHGVTSGSIPTRGQPSTLSEVDDELED